MLLLLLPFSLPWPCTLLPTLAALTPVFSPSGSHRSDPRTSPELLPVAAKVQAIAAVNPGRPSTRYSTRSFPNAAAVD